MQIKTWLITAIVLALFLADAASGQVQISIESAELDYQFKRIPSPAKDDAGTTAIYKILRGRMDPNSLGLEALNNAKMPADDDEPGENFFYAAGTDGGCLEVDLGRSKRTTNPQVK